jgi:hypothetical protein
MKFIHKSILFIAILFIVGYSQAQNLGYMGKRFLLNLETRVSPTLLFPNYYGSDYFFSLDASISPGIEFIVFNSGTIGVNYSLVKTQFESSYWSQNYPLEITGYSFFYKQYFRTKDEYYQAPFGPYGLVRFDYMFLKTPGFMGFVDDEMWGVKLEFGYDYLVWDRVRLSWGISFGLTNKMYKSDFFDDYYNVTNDTKITNRAFVNYVYNNKLAIGILLF